MNPGVERLALAGPAGALEAVLEAPAGEPRGLAVLCHPHPLHGGTMDNKVVQTLARALRACGWRTLRFNYRGVGASQGQWDGGRGEVDDALAAIAALRAPRQPLVLGGFSFGGYVAAQAAQRLAEPAQRLVLVAPATGNFELAPVPQDSLVVHGEHDEVVPLVATLAWARPQALPIVVVPGGGHFFHGQLPLLKSIVVRAFAA
jgi:alpha/beta superfamily hydrolase